MHKRVFAVVGVLFTLGVMATVWSSYSGVARAQEKKQVRGAKVENAQPEAVFTNSTAITIFDNSPASLYPSQITVSGITGNIPASPSGVKVTLNGFSHTFPDDVAIALVGPTGAALLLQDGAGAGPDMNNITYSLSDAGTAQLPSDLAWPAGTYKPTSFYDGDEFPAPGPGTAYGNPGPGGGGTATFASVFAGTNPNGVWKLFVIDFVTGDVGSINGGWSIEITPAVIVNDAPVDMNGDGKSDFPVTRNVGGGVGGALRWLTKLQNGSPIPSRDWGIASDQIVPADYDGDQVDDIAVFRPGTQGVFYIIRSASNTLYKEEFGQTGDDATVVGDYTGDNVDDLAVYRAGATPGAQSFWYYRSIGSPGGVQVVEWGVGGDFPSPGDYDGDGKYDFVVQRPDSNGVNGRFFKRMASGAQNAEMFGLKDDVIAPGDYDGDGKTDLCVVRADTATGFYRWDFEPSGTAGTTVVTDTWGEVAADDYITQGDYDGDGKTEYGVYRPATGIFYMMTVGTRAITSVRWGEPGDIPAANYNEH